MLIPCVIVLRLYADIIIRDWGACISVWGGGGRWIRLGQGKNKCTLSYITPIFFIYFFLKSVAADFFFNKSEAHLSHGPAMRANKAPFLVF